MTHHVVVLPQAHEDADGIYDWIAERSRQGANRWYARFMETVKSLTTNPELHGLAPESEIVGREIRQTIFKTKQGLPYRLLFDITENNVRILHVCGPGQDLINADEF